MKKDTLYALLGLLLTSAGAFAVLFLVFAARNPKLFEKQEAKDRTQAATQAGEWQEAPEETVLSPQKEADEEEALPKAGEREDLSAWFYTAEISKELRAEMLEGLSDASQYEEILKRQRYVHVLHYDFNGEVQNGELLVYSGIAEQVLEIFKELYEANYPIEKIRLIHEYGWDDEASMADNNTSAFNLRKIAGTEEWSKHALGVAIDINPLYNPYCYRNGNGTMVRPDGGKAYADRTAECDYYIRKGDVCYQAFVSRGFSWGGDWQNPVDYQHFQIGEE